MTTEKGMSLVELMVSVAVIMIVLGGAGSAYLKLLSGFKTQSSISESYMENLCGLELLRYDIEMAGYGLPTNLDPNTYSEAISSGAVPNPNTFNDAPGNVRGAFAFSDDGANGSNNSDVLVIKSQSASINEASRKWAVLYWNGANWRVNRWNDADKDFAASERFILLDENRRLLSNGANWFYSFLTGYYADAGAFAVTISPALNDQKVYMLYGIDPDTDPRMPFNRVDYHIKKPASNFPTRCYPDSFILYRGTINQNGGARSELQPLLDCVQDFQVAFGRDTDGDLNIDTWSSDINSIVDSNANGIADEIIQQLREVRVFILFHEGRRDADYISSATLNLGDDDTGTLKSFNPAGDAVYYRWKILKIAVKPMNLQ